MIETASKCTVNKHKHKKLKSISYPQVQSRFLRVKIFFFSTIMKFADRISEHKRHYFECPKTPTNPKQQKPKPYGVILFVSLFQALLFECKFRARFPKIRTQYHTYTKPPTTILPKTITVKEMVKTTPNRKKATLKIGQENWNGFIEEFTKEYSGKNIVILGTHFEEIISSSKKILHGSLISKELFEKNWMMI